MDFYLFDVNLDAWEVVQSMGAEDILNLKIEKTEFRAIAPPRLMTKVGEIVYANVNMDRAHIFDPETEERLN